MRQAADWLELEVRSGCKVGRPIDDRQILDCRGMPVFQARVADAPAGQVPAPADRLDGFDRSQAALREPVEHVATRSARRNQGQLLDSKVFRLALELHFGRLGILGKNSGVVLRSDRSR